VKIGVEINGRLFYKVGSITFKVMYAYVWFVVTETKFLIFIGKTICLQMQQSTYFLKQLIRSAWTLLFMSFYMLLSRCVFLEQ
jgi:hypothetical protein